MAKILIESHPIPFDILGLDHLYLVYDGNDVADENDLIIRGGPDPIFDDITLEIDMNIEASTDARGSDTPEDRGSLEITSESVADIWSILIQVALQIESANISYNSTHNSNSVIATLLHSIGINIEGFIPLNTVWEELPGAQTILDFERDITGTSNANFISGWAQNDIIDGGDGNDTLMGASGDDTLIGGLGADRLDGGNGIDTASYELATAAVNVSLASSVGVLGEADGDTLTDIENLLGSAYNDTLIGDSNANKLEGGGGDDILSGGDGNDTLEGGAGYDTYIMCHGETGTDQIIDSDGDGVIQVNGMALTGTAVFYNDITPSWNLGHYTLTRTGTVGEDLTFTSGFEGDPSFIIKNFTNGDLGITLAYPNQVAANPSSPSAGTGTTYSTIDGTPTVYGGTAADDDIRFLMSPATVYGGAGNDTLQGAELYGEAGDDLLLYGFDAYGGSGNDTLFDITSYADGGDGDDTIYGGVTVIGGAGNDSIISMTAVYAEGGDGNDDIVVDNSAGNFTIYGGADADKIEGRGANAYLDGGDGDDLIIYNNYSGGIIIGGAGDDTISADWGTNTVSGGAGFDTYYTNGGNIDVSAESEGSRVYTGTASTITGGSGNDIFYAGNAADVLIGGDGADYLSAGGGNDSVNGGAGRDAIFGGDGNDTIVGGDDNDSISGGGDNDSITGDAGDDIIYGDAGNDYIDGGNDNDKLYGGSGLDTIWGGSGNDLIEGGDGNDSLVGGDGADTLIGGDGQDALYGGDGADRLEGGAGDDYIEGGDGDDFIIGGAGSDYIDGGAGIDTVSYENSSAGVNVDLANNSHYSGDAAWDNIMNVENIVGSNFSDGLVGTNGVNVLSGGNGNDSIYGLDGNDTIYGGAGDDYIEAGDGDDLIIGGLGSDYIDGGAGIDTVSYADSGAWVNVDLGGNSNWNGDAAWDNITNVENIIGSAYDDQLTGNSVANVLTGGAGNDTLTGGAGDDTFYFAVGHGLDVITDFAGAGSAGGDVIHLHQLGYTAFDGTLTANIAYDLPNSVATITTSGGTITVHGVTTAFVAGDFAFS